VEREGRIEEGDSGYKDLFSEKISKGHLSLVEKKRKEKANKKLLNSERVLKCTIWPGKKQSDKKKELPSEKKEQCLRPEKEGFFKGKKRVKYRGGEGVKKELFLTLYRKKREGN